MAKPLEYYYVDRLEKGLCVCIAQSGGYRILFKNSENSKKPFAVKFRGKCIGEVGCLSNRITDFVMFSSIATATNLAEFASCLPKAQHSAHWRS